MLIALATAAAYVGSEGDDRLLHAALRARGVAFERPVWDDATVDWSRFDACLIRSTWDYMERRDEYLAWAEAVAVGARLFHPPAVVRWNTCKTYLRELAGHGVPTAPTLWLDAGGDVDVAELISGQGWDRALLKPQVGATARETLRFSCSSDGLALAQDHVDRLLPREGLMLQPYLASVETEGELSIFLVDGEPTHAVRKLPVTGDYRVQEEFGGRDEAIVPPADELALARLVLARCERLCGCEEALLYARIDYHREAGGPLVNEVELVEPSLFFRHGPRAADALVTALLDRLG